MTDTIRGVAPLLESRFRDNPLRIYGTPDEPLFVAKDVCGLLGLSNPTVALESLESDERSKLNLGRQGETNVVTESGLYALIFKSRKDQAREFRKWVTSEVLPEIRKVGRYDMRELSRLELIELARNAELERLKLLEQAEKNRPKLEFVHTLSTSNGSQSIGEFAKALGTGRNRLFSWLRGHGYIMPGKTVPYQRWVESGLFEVSEGVRNDHVWAVTAITARGIAKIGEEFAGNCLIGGASQ